MGTTVMKKVVTALPNRTGGFVVVLADGSEEFDLYGERHDLDYSKADLPPGVDRPQAR